MAGTSFEYPADLANFDGAGLHVVEDRSQFGAKSLAWSFGAGAVLEVANIRSLSLGESGVEYGSHFPASPAFVMSVYNETPLQDALHIEFNGRVHFDLNLGFKGWRTVWVPFHEMQGRAPRPGKSFMVESVRFTAPRSAGTLWFDDVVFCQYIDDRHPYPGLEVPFIKAGGVKSNDHWMPKPPLWNLLKDLPALKTSPAQRADLIKISDRLWLNYFTRAPRILGVGFFRKAFEFDKPLKLEKQVEPIRYELGLGEDPDYFKLSDFGKIMLFLAREYHTSRDAELADLFAEATEYFFDQGWMAGSSQGTTHHFGYSTRELYTAFFLMQSVLADKGLLETVGESVRWQLDFGEMLDPARLESNLDDYNTQSVYRMMASFLFADPGMQSAFLNAYSDHLSSALALTDRAGGFKPDGTAWHHGGHYPAYAIGAFERIPVALRALSGTSFRVRKAGHANFKKAFLASTIYSNPFYWGLGQAGRHPLGGEIGALKEACLSLALSGSPDGRMPIDPEVAATYVRLWGRPAGHLFDQLDLDAAPPNGHWTFPYAALSVHRRADWSVNIKGYSRNVWASEIYRFDNRYGRYPSNGTVQILPNLPPEEAGYVEDGWDWNHPPGTTTIKRSFAELEPREPLVMFKSEETYAGGCAFGGNGVWAMKLNEGNGYTVDPVKKKMAFPGKLKARKSVFCFGNQLLCLGTGIQSVDFSAPVHTTLFQNGIKRIDDTLYGNGEGLLLDPLGNGYKILDGSKVVVAVGSQSSPNNQYSLRAGRGKKGASARASGLFSKAWIDHGIAPKNGAYAYSVFPMVGSADFQALENDISKLPVLEILQQDNRAHIVRDPESGTVAYACFESGKVGQAGLDSVSAPCYVMIQTAFETMQVAVSNPNLNQRYNAVTGNYEGASHEAPVELKLNGQWKVVGSAEAWATVSGGSTRLRVKCIDGKSMEIRLVKSNDQALFDHARALEWTKHFFDSGSEDWNQQWLLDGQFANIQNTKRGMVFSAGPEEGNHAHHAVLWTKKSFTGDVRIEYDYTRLDKIDKWVNILYIQATGKGGEFSEDIMEWADYRREPWMRNYFETMNLLHISYAAYGKEDRGSNDDYVRCRRYPKREGEGFSATEITPNFFRTGLFRTGKTYHITVIKKGDRLFFNVKGKSKETLFSWQSPLIGEISAGRIGLRHMWMKSARYKNFFIAVLAE